MKSFSGKNKDVYVNTHYQHFKKTIEEIQFKKDSTNLFISVVNEINEGIRLEYDAIQTLETDFLKILYPKHSLDSAREAYREDVKTTMRGFSVSSRYLELRDSDSKFSIKDAISSNFNYIEKDLRAKKIIGDSKNADGSLETVVQRYMKEKLALMQKFFGDLSDFLDSIYEVISKLHNLEKPTLLNTMRTKAALIRQDSKKLRIGRTLPPTFEELLKTIKKIQNGQITKFTDLGDNFHSKMFTAVNESMYEYVAAAVLSAVHLKHREVTLDLVLDMLKKGDLEVVGQEGQNKASNLGTTDIIFYLGKLAVGIDVKANREIYTHNETKKDHMINMLTNVIKSAPLPFGKVSGAGGNEDFANIFAYAFVNMMTMNTIRGAKINVNNAAPVNEAEMRTDLFIPIQRITLISVLAHFIDEYLGRFKTARRAQIVVLLGDNIVFLTEFLTKIKNIINTVAGNPETYDTFGYVDIGSIQKNVEK